MPNFVLVKDIIKTKKYQKIKIRDVTMLFLQHKNVNKMFEKKKFVKKKILSGLKDISIMGTRSICSLKE